MSNQESLNQADSHIWGRYYETLWENRRHTIQKIIDEGESHPLRVIKKFESHERLYPIKIDTATGQAVLTEEAKSIIHDRSIKNFETKANGFRLIPVEHLPTGVPLLKYIPMLHHHVQVPYYHQDNLFDLIVDFTRRYSFEAVVELGSGYGKNLIELFYNGGPAQIPYYAGEYTESGTKIASELARLCLKDFELKPFRYDHSKPDLSFIREKMRVLFFTCHTIEQVFQIPSILPKTIADHAQEVTCIHFEPFGFQLKDRPPEQMSEVDDNQVKFFGANRWNHNLLATLLQNHMQQHITLEYVGKNILGGHMGCPTSIAVWKKGMD